MWRQGEANQLADIPKAVVTLGIALQPTNALIFIALDKGLFAAEGLEVKSKMYQSGALALKDLAKGVIEVTSNSIVPLVAEILKGEDFRVVAGVAVSGDEARIAARKDRGILAPQDLKGKSVGTQQLSAVHFFLHNFLLFHDLSEKDIDLKFLDPGELPLALARGEIDAFAMREPYLEQAKKLLGDNLIIFEQKGTLERRDLLVVRSAFITSRPLVIDKIIRALAVAADFAKAHPDEAKAIVAGRLGVSLAAITEIWPAMQLTVRLDQPLIVLMENVARWMIENKLVATTAMPNFLDTTDPSSLERVQGHQTDIIR